MKNNSNDNNFSSLVSRAGKKLLATTAMTALGLSVHSASVHAADDWTGHTVVGGGGSIAYDALPPENTTNITQTGHRVKVQGDADIKAGWTVNVAQDSSKSQYILFDVEDGKSIINGNLNANGEIFIFDNHGVVFGENSRVDVSSIIASSGNLTATDAQLDAGKILIELPDGAGDVINNGAINVAEAGLAAFVAPNAINNGIINAKMGTVAMAAGQTVTLDLYGDGLVEVAVDGELAEGLIENTGTINAQGGNVKIAAAVAKSAVENVINMDGVVDVSSASVKGGKIVLSGGSKGAVSVAGKLDASGKDGGKIEVTGENVHVTETAELTADANENGNGGTAYIYGNQYAVFEGLLSARGGSQSGNGGNAEISGGEGVGYNGLVDLSAANGATGTLLIDPKHIILNNSYSFFGFGFGPDETVTIYDQALANTLRSANVNLWATEDISTGSEVDISTWSRLRSCGFFCFYTEQGTTENNLTLAAPEININHDIILGNGDLNLNDLGPSDSVVGFGIFTPPTDIDVETLNLNAVVRTRSSVGGATSLAADSQINTDADTINVTNVALIQQAIHFADASDADAENINLAAQTFINPSQIIVDRDVNISGAGKTDTIINPGFDTGSSGDSRGWWLVNPGAELNLSDLTMDGNGQLVWQGIRHRGSGTIDNVLFNDIQFNPSEPNYAGTAVAAFGDGTIDVTNSMFTNIGRIGMQYFGAGVSGSTFSNNMYTGKGAGDWLDYGVEVGGGAGDIQILDNVITDNLGVASVDGSTSAGILITTFFGAGSGATIAGNTLTDNTSGVAVGFNAADSSAVEFGTGNVITGGEHGLIIRGADVDIVGDTLSDIVFGGQSDSFVQLISGAEFAPGMPNIIDGTGVTWGTYGILPTGTDAVDVENMITHFADTGTDGLINFGSVVVNNNVGEGTFDGSIQKGVNLAGLNGIGNLVVAGSGTSYGGSVEVWADGLKVEGTNYMGNDTTIDVATADAFSNIGDVNDGFVVSDSGAVGDGSDVVGVNIDPIVFSGSGDGVVLGTGGSAAVDATVDGNTFTNTGVGVKFDNVDGTTTISNNDIDTGSKAIQVNEKLDGDTLNITGNTQLRGAADAIEFTKGVEGAIVNISSNDSIIGDGSSSFGDAIDFRGLVKNSDVTIQYNDLIQGNDDGLQFAGGVDGGRLTIFGNTIKGLDGEGIVFLNLSAFGGDAVNSVRNGAYVYIGNSVIEGNGPDGDTDNLGGNGDGVLFTGNVDGSILNIGTSKVTGYDDGINFNGGVIGSTISIFDNKSITGTNDDGIDFNRDVEGSTVAITGNDKITGGSSNGIEFRNVEDGSSVEISNNNDGIHAGDHGIYFGSDIDGADIDIHDNIIGANENEDHIGSGIWFEGDIENATVNIGDGGYSTSSSSNIIRVGDNETNGNGVSGLDGIHFDGEIGDDAEIEIDGNRIGYNANSVGGTNYRRTLPDDGIEFANDIKDNADIKITDNWIRAEDDGIQFSDDVKNRATILIGGTNDGNFIRGGDNGISFLDEVKDQSLVEIAHNDIEGDDNGILFADKTSSEKTYGGSISSHEIYIHQNEIKGGNNGVNFEGEASGNRHDIKIENNEIEGEGEHGIVHSGGINRAHLKILNNEEIKGRFDGVHVEGNFRNNAKIDIDGNENVRGVYGDGIEVTETGNPNGADVNITDNHVHYIGDNGIEVANVNGVEVSENTVHNTDENGVYVSNSDNADITGNTIYLNGENGILVNPSDFANISGNSITAASENGIKVDGGTGHDIRENTIRKVGNDGIHIHDFGSAWIAYNDIKWTGDDGIHAHDGDFVSIYNNYVDLSGYLPRIIFPGNNEVGEDANGIYVNNVGGGDLPPMAGETDGFGTSKYGYTVEVYGNDVANSEDDGIQVKRRATKSVPKFAQALAEPEEAGYTTYIADNIVGHVGDDGIDVDNYDAVMVRDNAVTLAEDRGITIHDGQYAGVFDNRVLLTGDDGIHVGGIYGGQEAVELGDTEYGYGWSVNVSGNEVAFAGDDGIEVHDSGPTKVQQNRVFAAGLGEGLSGVIGFVNDFANGSFNPFATFGAAPSSQSILSGFSWNWGDGHGINVHGIDGAYYSPNGWAADIRGNRVKYTGGHGILAEDNDRTRIANNRTRYSGIDEVYFGGHSSMASVLDSGPFADEGRRDLWKSEGTGLVATMESFFGVSEPEEPEYDDYTIVTDFEFDSHDGIHAENIYGQYEEGLSGRSYLYDLKIKNNDVRITGDDGIEVDGAGRTLIADNTVRHSGFGDNYDYGSGDYYGADGIHARNVSVETYINPWVVTRAGGAEPSDDGYNYEPAENYALIIRNNDVRRTADDGIEVIGDGIDNRDTTRIAQGGVGDYEYGYYSSNDRVLIAENTVRRAGVVDGVTDGFASNPNLGADGYGHDGIHVRGINGRIIEDSSWLAREGVGAGGPVSETGYYGYAVDIIGNDVRRTGDDGIEVISSASTLILNNDVRRAGVGGGYYYGGADYYGADGIHVRNVGNTGRIFNPWVMNAGNAGEGGYGGEGFEPYAVVIDGNDVRNTQDDGIEVVGEGRGFDVMTTNVQSVAYNPEWDDDYGYTGTGRTLIVDNKVRNAGALGDNDDFFFYGDGYGADGIHVRGVVNIFKDGPYSNDVSLSAGAGYGGFIGNGNGYDVQIMGNDIKNSNDEGIEVRGAQFAFTNLLVEENDVENSGDNGIMIASPNYSIMAGLQEGPVQLLSFPGGMNSDVFGNTVINSDNNGLAVKGPSHNDVVVSGNDFSGFDIGAYFESGLIDLTGEGNKFTDGNIGMKFSPAIVGYEYPNDDFSDFARVSVGEPIYAPMKLVDDTIGAQRFEAIDDQYVELDNGAFFDPGTPTLLNALDSTYVGTPFGTVTPSVNFPGGFTPAQLAYFESKFYHFNDDNSLGLFFFPLLVDINQEDIFRYFSPNDDALGGLQVTILGLPSIPGGIPVALNSIAPAAGGEVTPEQLNAIETAAGGEDGEGGNKSSCFGGSALGLAQAGQPVNIEYSGDAVDLLSGEDSCS